MNYKFPVIRTLDDVLPHIEGRDAFKVGRSLLPSGENLYFVSYNFSIPGITFPPVVDLTTAILRECRGLIFRENKAILGRRFHKFFNFGEVEETKENSLPSIKECVIEDKIDGSMISSHFVDGVIYFFSKRGYTEVAIDAGSDFDNLNTQDQDFIFSVTRECYRNNWTPIWEYTSPDPKRRIVIDYGKPKFTLLTIRDTISGAYVVGGSNILSDIPRFNSWVDLSNYVKYLEDIEGYVARHDETGHRLKFKTDWYLVRHRALDIMKSPHRLLQIILEDRLDDIIGSFHGETKEAVLRYAEEVQHFIMNNFELLQKHWTVLRDKQLRISSDHKELKRALAPYAQQMEPFKKVVFFSFLDGNDCVDSAIKYLLKFTTTRTKLNEINTQLPGFPKLRWSAKDDEE